MLNAPQPPALEGARGRFRDRSEPILARANSAAGTTRWIDAGAIALAMLLVGGPLVFTRNGFGADFTNHLWLAWVQQKAISQHLVPTYFLNARINGVFYPFFAFYGGTLYAATGALGVLIGGQIVVAFVAVTLIAIGAAYGGMLWLARQLGARGWMTHAPAITFVASAYYVTNLYGRGAWPEVIATSMIPLVAASALRLARAPRVELAPAVALVVSIVFFSGSQNVTLLLGASLLVLVLVLLRAVLGSEAFALTARRVLAIGGLIVLGIAVNAWFLIPDIAHASDTLISIQPPWKWSFNGFFKQTSDPLQPT